MRRCPRSRRGRRRRSSAPPSPIRMNALRCAFGDSTGATTTAESPPGAVSFDRFLFHHMMSPISVLPPVLPPVGSRMSAQLDSAAWSPSSSRTDASDRFRRPIHSICVMPPAGTPRVLTVASRQGGTSRDQATGGMPTCLAAHSTNAEQRRTRGKVMTSNQPGVSEEALASISTPDHVESRLGRLEFVDGHRAMRRPSCLRAPGLHQRREGVHRRVSGRLLDRDPSWLPVDRRGGQLASCSSRS